MDLKIFFLITCYVVFAQVAQTSSSGMSLFERLNQTTTETSNSGGGSTGLALFKEPNSWLIKILEIFFDDIKWPVIDAAREEVIKFISRVERLLSGNGPISKDSTGKSQAQNRNQQASRFFGGSSGEKVWWKPDGLKTDPLALNDASNVRDMLQKVACFVGYMRILNQANEALADLDASKVVSNLFSSSSKTNESGGYFSRWFG